MVTSKCMNSVIIRYYSLEDFVDKLIEQEKIVEEWLKENHKFEVYTNSYLGPDNTELIETIIIKLEN